MEIYKYYPLTHFCPYVIFRPLEGLYGKTSHVETSTPNSSSADQGGTPPIIDHTSLNPHYITGLCDAQASFTYIKNGNSINLRFGLKLGEVDKNLIFALQGFFAGGNVYYTPRKNHERIGGGTWYYCVTRISEIGNIIAHFENHPLLGRKRDIYSLWKRMVAAKQNPRKPDLIALKSLAEQISALNNKGRKENPPRAGGRKS